MNAASAIFESGAFDSLVATVPRTLAGTAAMLAYVRAWLAEGHQIDDEEQTITLLGSIECAVCRAAGVAGPHPTLPRKRGRDFMK